MIHTIKKHAMALAALTIAIGSLTMMSFNKQTDVRLHFEGNPEIEAEVKNPNNWAEDNPNQSCSGSKKACSMDVNASDLQGSVGSRTLNTTKIVLGASNTGSGYVPFKASGSSTNNITPINRD